MFLQKTWQKFLHNRAGAFHFVIIVHMQNIYISSPTIKIRQQLMRRLEDGPAWPSNLIHSHQQEQFLHGPSFSRHNSHSHWQAEKGQQKNRLHLLCFSCDVTQHSGQMDAWQPLTWAYFLFDSLRKFFPPLCLPPFSLNQKYFLNVFLNKILI